MKFLDTAPSHSSPTTFLALLNFAPGRSLLSTHADKFICHVGAQTHSTSSYSEEIVLAPFQASETGCMSKSRKFRECVALDHGCREAYRGRVPPVSDTHILA